MSEGTRKDSPDGANAVQPPGYFTGRPAPFSIAMLTALVGFAMLPPFMVGALAVEIRKYFALSNFRLGAAVAVFFLVSAATSRVAGSFAETDGGYRALVASSALTLAAFLGLGGATSGASLIIVWCAVAGVGNALVHVSVNMLFVRRVTLSRLGITFGIKQAAIPMASLVAGMSVPVSQVLGSWQRPFQVLAVPVLGLAVWATLEARKRREAYPAIPTEGFNGLASKHVLTLIAVGAGLAVGAATIVATFTVVAGSGGSLSSTEAAMTLVAGSAMAVVLRVGLGMLVDRRVAASRPTGVSTAMVAVLAVSSLALLLVDNQDPWRFALGASVGLGFGWAWHGLMDYSVVRLYSDNPGRATGTSQIGAYVGGVLGPLAGGSLAGHQGFGAIWLLCSLSMAGAAASFALAGVAARRSQDLVDL
jgi:MFS family permease